MPIIHKKETGCEDCKYYESYHQFPNPLAVAEHWCTKCKEEIYLVKQGFLYTTVIPKKCYFNKYYKQKGGEQ